MRRSPSANKPMWQTLRNWWIEFRRPLTLGERGERLAARFLRKLGYIIVARSQRTALGEIDLIAVDGKTIVFVEVKTRTSIDAGHPADAVDQRKQQRLTRLALAWLKRHRLLDSPTRFDVIAITWPETPRSQPSLAHYKSAFEATGEGQLFS